jgi:hypothetical protein
MSQPKSVYTITGGGTKFISRLLSKGGASKFIEEIIIPYGTASSSQLLGYTPKKYACAEVARHLAVKSYYRCRELIDNESESVLGLGVTCKLKAEDEREGRRHEVHIAVHRCDSTSVSSFSLNGSRKEEEDLTAYLIEKELESNIYDSFPAERFHQQFQPTKAPDLIDLVRGKRSTVALDHIKDPFLIKSPVIFPGSFNPAHYGHAKMAELAYHHTGQPVYFELCIHNTDKPSLDHIDIHYRYWNLIKFCDKAWYGGIILTTTPLFIDKINYYITPRFIVGTDTLSRIMDRKYYNKYYDCHMDKLSAGACSFLHFKRNEHEFPKVPRECEDFVIQTIPYVDDGVSSSKIRVLS